MTTNDDSNTQLAVATAMGAFALVFLLFGIALAIYPGWSAIGTWAEKADAPTWVQAIGSVCAILAAGAVCAWQSHITLRVFERQRQDAKRRDERLSRQRKQMVLAAAGYVRYVTKQQLKRLKERKDDKNLLVIKSNLSHLRGYCEGFPIWSMENSTLAGRWGGILEAVVNAESTLTYEIENLDTALTGILELCTRLSIRFRSARDEILTHIEDEGMD